MRCLRSGFDLGNPSVLVAAFLLAGADLMSRDESCEALGRRAGA
jgi:hypothetical protein